MIQDAGIEASKSSNIKGDTFVLADERTFTLKQPFQKILGFCPMFNDSCVVLGIKSHRVECVSHINSAGKIIKEHTFNNSNLFSYAIISDREIVWLNVNQNQIMQWNLETNNLLRYPFMYLSEEVADSHELYVFPQSNLICVADWGRRDSNAFRLTYFRYPLRQDSQPVAQFQEDNVWTYDYNVRRGNTKSLILWFESQAQDLIKFSTFELEEDEHGQLKGKYTPHRVENPLKINNKKASISVGNIWEMTPKKYMLVTITDRPQVQGQYPNSIFVYQEKHNLFREAKFSLPGKFRVQCVDYCSFGNTAVIRTFNFISNYMCESPIFYISNQEERIIATETWKCSHLNKYSFPAYDLNLIVDVRYTNANVTQILSRSVKVVPMNELAANLLVQIVPEIDEDLLCSIVDLLKNEPLKLQY